MFFAMPAAAQTRVEGLVVDGTGKPVAGATIDLWAGSRHTSTTQTSPQGRFAITAGASGGAMMLTVRRVGLQTETVELASPDTSLVVTMHVQPVLLEPVTVASTRQRACPNREDPRARAVWERMRTRYWQPPSATVFAFGFMELRSGVGEKTDAFDPRAGRTSTGWTTGALVVANPELMARSGYAEAASGGVGERTAFWDYRALDQGSIQDFAGDYFGTAHTLSMVASAAGEATLVFCPRERRGQTGQIEGTLVLGRDTTLNFARWAFRTPRPDEEAGGEASYYPPEPELGRALLARETVFWRMTSQRRFYFEARAFTGWRRWHRAASGPAELDAQP